MLDVHAARSYACKNTEHACRGENKEKPLTKGQVDECYIKPVDTQGTMAGMVSYIPLARRAVSGVAGRMISQQPEETLRKQMEKLTPYFPGGEERQDVVNEVAKELKGSKAAGILLDDSCRELMKSLGVTQEDLDKLKDEDDEDDEYSFEKLTSKSFGQEARDRVVSAALVLVLDLGIGAKQGTKGDDKGKLVQEMAEKIRDVLPEKVEKFLVGPDQIHDFLAAFVDDEGYQENVASRLRQLVCTGFGNMLKANDKEKETTKDGNLPRTAVMLDGLISGLVDWAKSPLNLEEDDQEKVDEYKEDRKYSCALTHQGFSASSQAVVLRTAALMSELVAAEEAWPHYAARQSREYNPLLEQLAAVPKKIDGERTDLAPGRNRYIAYMHHPGMDGKLDVARARHILVQTYTSGRDRCINVPAVVQGLIDTRGSSLGRSRKALMQALTNAGLVTTDKGGKYAKGKALKPFGNTENNRENLRKFVECITYQNQIRVIGRAILNATLTLQDKLNRSVSEDKKDKYEGQIANLEVAFQALFRSVSIDVLKMLETVEAQHAEKAEELEKSTKKHSRRGDHDSGSESDTGEDEDSKPSGSRKRRRKRQTEQYAKRRRTEETDDSDMDADEDTPARKKSTETKKSTKSKKQETGSSSSEGAGSEVEEPESDQDTSGKKSEKVSSKKRKQTSGKKPVVTKTKKPPKKKQETGSSSSEGAGSEVEEPESDQDTSGKKSEKVSSKKRKQTSGKKPVVTKTKKPPKKKQETGSSSSEGAGSEVEEPESDQDTSGKKSEKVSSKKRKQTSGKKPVVTKKQPKKQQETGSSSSEGAGSEVEESDQGASSKKSEKVSSKKRKQTSGKKPVVTKKQPKKQQETGSSSSEGAGSEVEESDQGTSSKKSEKVSSKKRKQTSGKKPVVTKKQPKKQQETGSSSSEGSNSEVEEPGSDQNTSGKKSKQASGKKHKKTSERASSEESSSESEPEKEVTRRKRIVKDTSSSKGKKAPKRLQETKKPRPLKNTVLTSDEKKKDLLPTKRPRGGVSKRTRSKWIITNETKA